MKKIQLTSENQKPAGEAKFQPHELDHMASQLMDAEAIKNHKVKMAAIMKHMKGKMKTIHSIQGLRDKRKALQEEQGPNEAKNVDESAEGE